MNYIRYRKFPEVLAALTGIMRSADRVPQSRWQGVDVSGNPAATCYEVTGVGFEVDLGGVEDLDHWRGQIGPNLPWADDHFAERVGGQPLNPGVQWKNWPWGQSANRFRKKNELGPRFPQQDWAYLAAMIDGEGTVYFKKHKQPTFQGRVQVGQKDRAVLDYLCNLFKVGKICKMPVRPITIRKKVYNHHCYMWNVTSIADIKWLLTNCMPYFRVKKEKAIKMLAAIDECDKVNGDSPKSHRKTVWNREWPAVFNHTYMERLWPNNLDSDSNFYGHRRPYGNLNDLVDLLVKDPYTRQAWIPLFFPEDTGWQDGGRKMCSLGYQFLVRNDRISVWYPLRSCDLVRHLRDDCYLAVRLLLWVLDRCREKDGGFWGRISPGTYSMHVTSLHVFENDMRDLRRIDG